ncbi:MAG: sterol desaturase family protein [Gammaproteobacteria bacterium]
MIDVFHNVVSFAIAHPMRFMTLLFVARIAILTAVERLYPAHSPPTWSERWRDVGAMLVVGLAAAPAAAYANRWFAIRPAIPHLIMELPLVARFFLYLVIADFGHYWVHRLLHTRHLWRVHKWHHQPTYMYWLAGVRGSFLQSVLVNLPYIFAGVLLQIAPAWMAVAILSINVLQNDWMHLNVGWGTRWLEWFVVTPRYHHLHHSDDPVHYRGNLAPLFTVWDRLFGTYVDPARVTHKISFGIGERVSPVRLAVGV